MLTFYRDNLNKVFSWLYYIVFYFRYEGCFVTWVEVFKLFVFVCLIADYCPIRCYQSRLETAFPETCSLGSAPLTSYAITCTRIEECECFLGQVYRVLNFKTVKKLRTVF